MYASLFSSLHREALKQSATDPLSGKIDVGILTTGLSTAARKKRADLVASIKENLKKKGKLPTVPWQKLFSEIKEASQIVSLCFFYFNVLCVCVSINKTDAFPCFLSFQLITREQFEDALKELQDEGVIVVMGKNTIRIC